MAAAFVKATLLTSSSGNNVSGTVASTAGNLLAACASSFGASAFSASGGGTWTADITRTASNADAAIITAPNCTGGSQTVTVTATGSTIGVACSVHEYSGMATSSPLDTTAPVGTSGSGTAITGSSETNVQAAALFVAMLSTDAATSFTGTGTGWTYSYISGTEQMQDTDAANHEPFSSGYKIVASAAAQNSAWTISPSTNWTSLIACYKAGVSAAVVRTLALTGVGV